MYMYSLLFATMQRMRKATVCRSRLLELGQVSKLYRLENTSLVLTFFCKATESQHRWREGDSRQTKVACKVSCVDMWVVEHRCRNQRSSVTILKCLMVGYELHFHSKKYSKVFHHHSTQVDMPKFSFTGMAFPDKCHSSRYIRDLCYKETLDICHLLVLFIMLIVITIQ